MEAPSDPRGEDTPQVNTEVESLREVLKDTMEQRARHYRKVFAFTVRFEADDTSAIRDSEHFQQMLEMLGLPQARELVIGRDERAPGWTVSAMIGELAKSCDDNESQYLIIGHYAGHAAISEVTDKLIFLASPSNPKSMSMGRTLGSLCDKEDVQSFPSTDVLLILDCCYGGITNRGNESGGRSVEIIASVAHDQKALGTPSDLARVVNRTFTARLADEVARRIGRDDTTSISFAEVVDELRRTSQAHRLPQYRLDIGRVGIRIPLPSSSKLPPHLRRQGGSSENSVGSLTTPAPMLVMFRVHLKGTKAGDPEVEKLVQWIQSLHPNIGFSLEGVYMTRSTEIIFVAPWHLWAPLSDRRDFTLLCDFYGCNMLPAIQSKSVSAAPAASAATVSQAHRLTSPSEKFDTAISECGKAHVSH